MGSLFSKHIGLQGDLCQCSVLTSTPNPLVQLHPARCGVALSEGATFQITDGLSKDTFLSLFNICVSRGLQWAQSRDSLSSLTAPLKTRRHNYILCPAARTQLVVFRRYLLVPFPVLDTVSHHASMCGKSNKVTGLGNQRIFSFKARLATCLQTSPFLLLNQSLGSHGCNRGGKSWDYELEMSVNNCTLLVIQALYGHAQRTGIRVGQQQRRKRGPKNVYLHPFKRKILKYVKFHWPN